MMENCKTFLRQTVVVLRTCPNKPQQNSKMNGIIFRFLIYWNLESTRNPQYEIVHEILIGGLTIDGMYKSLYILLFIDDGNEKMRSVVVVVAFLLLFPV
jgi:hypothetical protein